MIKLSCWTSHKMCIKDLQKQGVTHLGWLNDGIKVPKGPHSKEVFANKDNSECVYLLEQENLCYSVDMSD